MGTWPSGPSADVAVRCVDADSVLGIPAHAQGRRLSGRVLGGVSEQFLNDAVDGSRHGRIDPVGVLDEDARVEGLTGTERCVNDLRQIRQRRQVGMGEGQRLTLPSAAHRLQRGGRGALAGPVSVGVVVIDEATRTAQALTVERDEIMRRNEEIFAQLEEAVELSVKPLDDMFAKVGVNTDKLLETVRQGYEGTGGPLTPMGYSSRGNAEISESEARAQEIVVSLDKVNRYRIAVSKLPLAMPVKSAFRFTSPFGQRWGRAHQGIDLAGPVGTPVYVYSTATLARHFNLFREALAWTPHLVCYAVKANSNLAVLKLLGDLGAGMDVVSGGEYARARAAVWIRR